MFKSLIFFILLILMIFLISCTTGEISLNETITEEVEETTDCLGHFICISSTVSAYKDTSCEIRNRTTCETECVDGLCKEPEIMICTSGFKCKNQYEYAFQLESCKWDKREKCEFGCDLDNNECHTASLVNETESEDETTTITNNPVLKQGELVNINDQDLSIYIIEDSRVQLKLGSQKSNWLNEGNSYSYKDGTKITIKEILFQPYDGGKREVSYVIG